MAVVELLDEPGEPARASLGHDHPELWVAFEDAPGEQIDKGLEEIAHEEFGVFEDARGIAGGPLAQPAEEYRDVPREDDAGVFEQRPERLPSRIVELWLDVGDLQIDLAHAAF